MPQRDRGLVGASDVTPVLTEQLRNRGQSGAMKPTGRKLDAAGISTQTTTATVLFADMRGYTGLAEQLAAAQVVPLLDEFFTLLARVTLAFGGQVFHMAGDSMMAGFAFRDPGQSGARAALGAGLAMIDRFASVATRWKRQFAQVTGIGIGLHFGEVALGFLGAPGKQAITLVGDAPNVAARLCSRASAGELRFSGAVASALCGEGGGPCARPTHFLQLPRFGLYLCKT